jgi:hypothetical protein
LSVASSNATTDMIAGKNTSHWCIKILKEENGPTLNQSFYFIVPYQVKNQNNIFTRLETVISEAEGWIQQRKHALRLRSSNNSGQAY